MDQCLIFSRAGIWIDQIRAPVERGWSLVSESTAQFSISVFDPKCNNFTLRHGNLILVENSDGLPPWVGMIDDIGFDNGRCIVTAYTLERYFFYRTGPRKLTFTGPAGGLFRQLLEYVNKKELTVLQPGNIESKTADMQETINPVSLSNNLTRIVNRSKEVYWWRPQVVDGKLVVYADWTPSRFIETNLILQDGYNITGNHPMQLSAPVNSFLAYGNGANWDVRPYTYTRDDDSVQEYGLRNQSKSVNTTSVPTLQETSDSFVQKNKQPNPSFPLTVLNKGDTFSKLIPGAVATFTKLVGSGFSNGRPGHISYDLVIQSMAFSPLDGVVEIAI